jgi:pyrroloquinoline quinone biosynthesis protein E
MTVQAPPEAPLAILAELTHRCPLQCPYCSNPVDLARAKAEMGTADWLRAIGEAAALGCMQIHFSGGEPTIRPDLEALVAGAAAAGLYTNLITSGVLCDGARLAGLVEAGLEHVQLSFQDNVAATADRIGGYAGGHDRKLAFARLVREAGLPLTANFVVHRQNLAHIEDMIELARAIGAQRVEIANVQYYGWALRNRAALMPGRAELDAMVAAIESARARLAGIVTIDFVVPDYYAQRPKSCMGGWGRRFLNIAPNGDVLPCHAAPSIAGLAFDNVRQRPLADIWQNSEAFRAFRGTDWMDEPCRTCDRREIDWGGCRCQAFALTGDARRTDPACALSGDHAALVDVARREAMGGMRDFVYRNYRAARANGPSATISVGGGNISTPP